MAFISCLFASKGIVKQVKGMVEGKNKDNKSKIK